MKAKKFESVQMSQASNSIHGEGPNWILITGGALLSTIAIRVGCKLKQAFETKPENSTKIKPEICHFKANSSCFSRVEKGCCYCHSDAALVSKQSPNSPSAKGAELPPSLVQLQESESLTINSGALWIPSPDNQEMPRKQFRHSSSSGSPTPSESGSDIYSKREVIQKLRQQLKRRDETIIDMQARIIELQSDLTIREAETAGVQSRLGSVLEELHESHSRAQQLQKTIADYCVASAPPVKPLSKQSWQANGHLRDVSSLGSRSYSVLDLENGRGECKRVEMLTAEVGELKGVIERMEFLIRSHKEENAELCLQLNELQQQQQQVSSFL